MSRRRAIDSLSADQERVGTRIDLGKGKIRTVRRDGNNNLTLTKKAVQAHGFKPATVGKLLKPSEANLSKVARDFTVEHLDRLFKKLGAKTFAVMKLKNVKRVTVDVILYVLEQNFACKGLSAAIFEENARESSKRTTTTKVNGQRKTTRSGKAVVGHKEMQGGIAMTTVRKAFVGWDGTKHKTKSGTSVPTYANAELIGEKILRGLVAMAEDYIAKLGRDSFAVARCANRVTIMSKDISAVLAARK